MAKKIVPAKKESIKEIALMDMTIDELKKKAISLSESITKARLEKSTGKLKNLRQAFTSSDQLARVLTVLNIKKMS
jgi:ribosomal protein L29